jgi:spore germination cell wall hydrolase CwlJ-like protein
LILEATMHEIRERDVDVLARTIYGEARGESMQGKRAVGNVVVNRARNPGWWSRGVDGEPDDSVAAVCLKPWQFSAWNHGDPNRLKVEDVTLDNELFRDCYYAALAVLQDRAGDPTDGATSYHATSMDPPPDWAQGRAPLCRIGGHAFYDV